MVTTRNVARPRRRVVIQQAVTPAKRARRQRQRQRKNLLFRELMQKCGPGVGEVVPQGAATSMPEPGMPITGGLTTDGSAWVVKALHPNGEEVTAVAGIPDHVSVPVVTPEFRNNTVIVPRPDAVDADNDDLDIVVLPFGDLTAIYRRYKAGAQPGRNGDWTPVWNPTFTITNPNDTFITTASDPTGGAVSVLVPTFESNMQEVYGYGRMTYKGVTLHLDAPATRDQGRVMAGQVAVPYTVLNSEVTLSGWRSDTKASTSVTTIADTYSLDTVPLDESCLIQSSPGAATWEAREGIYMPMRFRDPVHEFSGSGGALLATVTAPGLYAALVTTTNKAPPAGYTGNTLTKLDPRMLLNGLTGVILVRGVDAKANIHLKIRTGLEAQVDTCSSISPYQRMSPVLDCEAINMVARSSQEMPQVFPSSYNDFGILGSLFEKLIPIGKKIRGKIVDMKIPGLSGFMEWQNKNIYDPLGLNAPMRNMNVGSGRFDPLKRVYDRMFRNRIGGGRRGYEGLYG